jgi:hypothetical protein
MDLQLELLTIKQVFRVKQVHFSAAGTVRRVSGGVSGSERTS